MGYKIGILGSGDVARSLATGFLRHRHEVAVGSRTPGAVTWAHELGIRAQTHAETAAWGEILVLAVAGRAACEVLEMAGATIILGKIVIDVTNPIAEEPPEHGVLRFFTNANESLMERLQRAFPNVRFVKAFNSVGHALMIDPRLPGGKPTMFICGNDDAAKAAVAEIIRDVGWNVEDMGMVEAARPIEALCILWCIPGFLRNEWHHAFALMKG
jgi:predicted dinucleotide-binding enzyme